VVIKQATPLRSVNAGEIDPDAHSRIDIKQYYSGAAAMKNFEPVPQSGFRLMGGTRMISRQRGALSVVSISDDTTDAGPHTGTQTVWSGTVSGVVAVVHVTGISISAGTGSFTVEANVGGTWTAIGSAMACGTSDKTRTFAVPPQTGAAATAIRIRLTFSESATVAISDVDAYSEAAPAVDARFVSLTADDGTTYQCCVTPGMFDAFTDEGHAGSALLPLTTSAMLPDLDFYAEADTIGIFHNSTVVSQRVRRIGAGNAWAVDAWPYEGIPEVDLGGSYAKTNDVWDIFIRWADNIIIYMAVTVNGEATAGIPLTDSLGTPIGTSAGSADWTKFASDIETALQALPSLGAGVTVSITTPSSLSKKLSINFGGDYAGIEYDLSAIIVNTTEASSLANHNVVGSTAGEPLFSGTRGYPGTIELAQDRLVYARIPAKTGAAAFSATADYFNLNIEAGGDTAARLDNIRSQISEVIYHVKESKYLLVFTNRAAYFATNREITATQPLNFVKTSETGIRANTKSVDLDGLVYYASNNGEQIISLAYDDVTTNYTANPETLLASHLISGVKRIVRQIAEQQQDAAKMWILRDDGRLVAGQVIRNQDITGFCEWRLAQSGQAREIAMDGENRLWMQTVRSNGRFIELYDPDCLFQCALTSSCDMAGVVSGLDDLEGRTVWAEAQGYVLGPYTVTDGEIDLEDYYSGDVTVGLWIAPVFESMPQPLIVNQDDIVFRPGRIHSAHVNVIDTTSIAIGANGEAPQEINLALGGDPLDLPTPARTEMISRYGMLGSQVGPRLEITQLRPGRCRVRDMALEAKL
jgi:Flp pilus assembly pilin Flp